MPTPLMNVIRGQEIPDAPLNVRTPILRVPLWAAISWWTVKGGARLVGWYARHWYATVPATVVVWAYLRFGWQPVAIAAGGVAAVAVVWWWLHRASFLRLAG
jgi:hypothetical protein